MRLSIIPSKFFFFLPIQIGADIIAIISIFNKASAFYALGALVTSHPLTVVEWIVNVISVLELPLFIYLAYKVVNRDALASLAYAHIYIIDTLMNLGFTVYFIVHWFVVGAKKAAETPNVTREVINKSATVGQELAVTIVCTTFTLVCRFYFVFVIIGFARLMVSNDNLRPHNGEPQGSWRARLQYLMLRPFERFWTGHTSYQRLNNKPE